MSVLLGEFRTAVLAAAAEAVAKMQYQMMVESEVAIREFQWEWKGPISGDRPIIDTGALMNSIEPSPVEIKGNSITFSLKWDPVDKEKDIGETPMRWQVPEDQDGFHYASLVHDGKRAYFRLRDGGKRRDYTARPWTFLLMPAEQRDDSQLNTEIGPSVDSLPEDGWEACLKAFSQSFRQELSRTMKVIA